MDRRKKTVEIVALIVIAINLLATSFLFFKEVSKPKMVMFDMKETINAFITQLGQGNLTEQEIDSLTVKFNSSLDNVINDYSKENNVIILVSPAVVKGLNDVTLDIQNLVAEDMNK